MYRLLAALALVLLGCGDEDADSPVTGGSGRLRADIVEVLPPSDAIQVISDADVDGDRIVIVTVANIQYVTFHVSEDRGRTWQSYLLDDALGTDIFWDAGGLGVVLQDGKIFFMLTREFSPRTTEWGLFEVTLVPAAPPLGGTMTLTEITPSALIQPMVFHQKRPDGHLRGVATFAREVVVALELDPATGGVFADYPPCADAACTVDLWISGNGGDTFHGYSQTGPGVAMCRMTWSETAPAKQACIRPHEWFVPAYAHRNHVVVADDEQPYLVWSQDDEAYAIGITDAGALTPVHPLGPGRIENFAISRLGRPRFAGFELVYPLVADEGHLVRMTSQGPEQVQFRETPCVDVGCGYTGGPNFGLSLVNWIQPTGRGDYYVFYVVQSDGAGGNRQALYMSPSETPTFVPITPSGPLPGPPTFAPPTDAAPMTPIQQACIAMGACFSSASPGPGIAGCVLSLTTSNSFQPYAAAYRERLIAALPGGCPAILAATGSGAGTCSKQCTLSGGTCPAGSSTCSNLITLGAQQCNTCSDATTYLACDTSSTAFAMSCPPGTECSPNRGCVQTAFCDSNNATSCSGTDRTTCEFGTQTVQTEDCAGQGGTCALAACESTQVGAPCNDLTYSTQCQGPYITSCMRGKVVYADCRELGHATCADVAAVGYGRCVD